MTSILLEQMITLCWILSKILFVWCLHAKPSALCISPHQLSFSFKQILFLIEKVFGTHYLCIRRPNCKALLLTSKSRECLCEFRWKLYCYWNGWIVASVSIMVRSLLWTSGLCIKRAAVIIDTCTLWSSILVSESVFSIVRSGSFLLVCYWLSFLSNLFCPDIHRR